MKNNIKLVFAVILIASLLVLVLFTAGKDVGTLSTDAPKKVEEPSPVLIKCLYYDENDFRRSVMGATPSDLPVVPLKGGIVPHHLLAGNIISTFFSRLSAQKPELVIVVAPNHNGTGLKEIQTGNLSWETPFGILDTDCNITSSIIEDKTASENNELLEKDHSISALVPYIKYYMPGTRIVPILLSGNLGLEEAAALGREIIKKAAGKNYLIIASIDFSHYLPGSTADKMDEITLKAIEDRDYKKISGMGNDNLDSPPSLICFLSAMREVKAERFTVLDHSNSDKLTGANSESTTSYFSMLFHQ